MYTRIPSFFNLLSHDYSYCSSLLLVYSSLCNTAVCKQAGLATTAMQTPRGRQRIGRSWSKEKQTPLPLRRLPPFLSHPGAIFRWKFSSSSSSNMMWHFSWNTRLAPTRAELGNTAPRPYVLQAPKLFLYNVTLFLVMQ
jgi:hypothetical protein